MDINWPATFALWAKVLLTAGAALGNRVVRQAAPVRGTPWPDRTPRAVVSVRGPVPVGASVRRPAATLAPAVWVTAR